MTAAGQRNPEIEVLRTLAILCIVVANIPLNLFFWKSGLGDFEIAYWNGNCGVDLFLAISGYVVAASLFARLAEAGGGAAVADAIVAYLLRRFWRLMPPLLVWVMIPLVLSLVFNRSGAFHGFDADLGAAETSLLFVGNLWFGAAAASGRDASVLYPLWTLSLEQQFYLALPVIALLARGRILLVAAGFLAWQFVMPQSCLVLRTGALSAGVIVAVMRARGLHAAAGPVFLGRAAWRRTLLGAILLLLGVFQSDLARNMLGFTSGVSAVLCGVLVYAASFGCGYVAADGPLRRAGVWVGARALAIGLVHLPVFAFVHEMCFDLVPQLLWIPAGLAVMLLTTAASFTLIAAEATFRGIELPARRYADRICPPGRVCAAS